MRFVNIRKKEKKWVCFRFRVQIMEKLGIIVDSFKKL